jgi:hypothetical protein
MSKKEEQLVCEIINKTISDEDKNLVLYNNALELSQFLIDKYGRPINATWIGKCHSFRGDIILKYPKKLVEIELKVISSNSTSKGTLANITQDFFSKYRLLKGVIGWSDWRKNHSYEKTILALLSSISFTEDELNQIKNSKMMNKASKVELYGRALKYKLEEIGLTGKALAVKAKRIAENGFQNISPENIKNVKALIKIDKVARDDIHKYLEKCSRKKVDAAQVKKLLACLKFGYHNEKSINENINKSLSQIINESKNYLILYYYPNKLRDKFKIESNEIISKWIHKIQNFDGSFNEESFVIKNNENVLLKFKFHWRNVFFGIATPSIEVFDYLNISNL